MDDYIPVPVGTDLEVEVPLAGNIYNDGKPALARMKTTKPGAWYSIDAQKDVLKARVKNG